MVYLFPYILLYADLVEFQFFMFCCNTDISNVYSTGNFGGLSEDTWVQSFSLAVSRNSISCKISHNFSSRKGRVKTDCKFFHVCNFQIGPNQRLTNNIQVATTFDNIVTITTGFLTSTSIHVHEYPSLESRIELGQ